MDDTFPQVQGSTVILAFVALSAAAMSQRSYMSEYCGMTSGTSWSIYRASPIVCICDLACDLYSIYLQVRTVSTADKLEKQPLEEHVRERRLRWLPVVCFAFPVIGLALCRGIPGAQTCAVIYFAAILSSAASGHRTVERRPDEAAAVYAQILALHLPFLSAFWMMPLWHIMTDITEWSGFAEQIAIAKLCALAVPVLLLISSFIPLPQAWRVPNTALMALQPLVGLQLMSGYAKEVGMVKPKHMWEFLAHFYYGATVALIVPVAVAAACVLPVLWLRGAPIFAEGVTKDKEVDEKSAEESAENPAETKTYWSRVKSESWRIAAHGLYCLENFKVCFGWYLKLVPEARASLSLDIGALTLLLYYGLLYNGKDTSMPPWLHENVQTKMSHFLPV